MAYQKINLNGTWQLQPGDDLPKTFNYTVPVPAMVDNAEPLLDWQSYDYFWYKTEFKCTADADNPNIFLQLEQVQFGAEIWLNDKNVGYDIPCYTSQWYDISTFVNKNTTNTLLVRIGQKKTLPAHSAVGNDEERLAWLPGIWGNVFLHHFGVGRIEFVRIIADINNGEISVHCELENFSNQSIKAALSGQIVEKKSAQKIIDLQLQEITLTSASKTGHAFQIKLDTFTLWSPENPFLYVLQLSLHAPNGSIAHQLSIPFGMRSFGIKNGHFYLNNRRRVLLGSNIAFHRLLNDSTRGTLLWDEGWIKKAFIDIPKAHNLTFFRFHLGRAYNSWYDMADEFGILLEDEWGFWKSSGTPQQIEKEFTTWIKENINRPSIVIWNALNESNDKNITEDIIPRLKELDPTRPWQHVDFHEDHPYIYSLGPVLNDKQFGFARSIFELQESTSPTMVNEFEWWWLDRDNNPSLLTQIVVERWLGRQPDKKELISHQAFLAAELGELWRRLDLDAIMPFVYLSVGEGATANWFDGDLKDLQPKPVLAANKNAFSPLGISIELWDRHFVCATQSHLNIYLFNDSPEQQKGKLRVFDNNDHKVFFEQGFSLEPNSREIVSFNWNTPAAAQAFFLRAELFSEGSASVAWSEKIVHMFAPISKAQNIIGLYLADPSSEMRRLLQSNNIMYHEIEQTFDAAQTVLLNLQAAVSMDKTLTHRLTQFVNSGGKLILQEPEYAVKEEKHFTILKDLKLKINLQDDSIMGGYNSCVFMEDKQHALWKNIQPEHLKMFNGALGGEMVSAHDVIPNRDYITHARCGLSLAVPAVMEIPYGKGRVIISRIQLRGRLLKEKGQGDLYDRRYDPVAEQYFWNLITL